MLSQLWRLKPVCIQCSDMLNLWDQVLHVTTICFSCCWFFFLFGIMLQIHKYGIIYYQVACSCKWKYGCRNWLLFAVTCWVFDVSEIPGIHMEKWICWNSCVWSSSFFLLLLSVLNWRHLNKSWGMWFKTTCWQSEPLGSISIILMHYFASGLWIEWLQ